MPKRNTLPTADQLFISGSREQSTEVEDQNTTPETLEELAVNKSKSVKDKKSEKMEDKKRKNPQVERSQLSIQVTKGIQKRIKEVRYRLDISLVSR